MTDKWKQYYATREEYLENMLTVCHVAMTADDAHVGLLDDQWKELAEITKIPHPQRRVFVPYLPDEAEIKKLKDRPEYY